MKEKKERKSNLLTVRLTDDELAALDLMSDSMNKNKSDVIQRACKFFLNVNGGNTTNVEKDGDNKKERKVHRVHLRMADSDMENLKARSDESGDTISKLIRAAIRAFADWTGVSY